MTPRRNLVLALVVALGAFLLFQWLGEEGLRELATGGETARTWTTEFRSLSDLQQQIALAEAVAIQERSAERLFGIPGVVGSAIGLGAGGGLAIQLYATDEASGARLPSALEGVPVVIHRTEPFYALQEAATAGEAAEEGVIRTGRFERPVPIGVSAGHPNSTAGTIGALVTDGTSYYALSNHHVFAAGPDAKVGDGLLQPGVYDGGAAPADVIATLAAFEPIEFSLFANNRIDAALGLTEDVDYRTPSDGYGAPRTEPVVARPGLPVKKYGRTTGLTAGRVDAINATVNVRYRGESQTARFTGQIIVCCSASAGGDSGSLIVADDVDDEGEAGPDDRRPVALLFAGNGRFTIANPIGEVLDAFSVRIVGDQDESD